MVERLIKNEIKTMRETHRKIFKAHISLSIFRAKELEGLKKGGKQWVGESERSGVVASQAFCCSSIGLHESAPAGLSWTILS